MTPEQAQALRAPFPADKVGKLPRSTCRQCSNASGGVCSDHKKIKCAECDNYITERHIHLDYVGHGAVTDRLLEVDPDWSWEPLAFDQSGMPTFVYDDRGNPISLWIRLTVCGVTRLGVGTCPSGQGDAEKVLIGDALRNAALRFGVAVDLWIKGHGEDDERATDSRAHSTQGRGTAPSTQDTEPVASRSKIRKVEKAKDALSPPALARLIAFARAEQLPDPKYLTDKQADQVLAWLVQDAVDHPPIVVDTKNDDSGGAPVSDAGDTAQTEPAAAGGADMDTAPESSTASQETLV